MLLTAPGKTSHTPTVATVSREPLDRAPCSTAKAISAAARKHRGDRGISTAPGVPALAFDGYFEAGRRGDRRDHSQRHIVLLEQRSLFDVHFNEGGIISRRQAHG